MFKAEQSKIDILDFELEHKNSPEPTSKKQKDEAELLVTDEETNKDDDLEQMILNVKHAPADLLRNTIQTERQNSIDRQRYLQAQQ